MKYNNSHTLRAVFFFLLSFGLFSNAYGFKIRFTWYKGNKYVYLADVAAYYGMKLNKKLKHCELTSQYSKIKIKHGSKKAYLNGHIIHFSMSPIYNKNNPAISEKDFLLLLNPILRKETLKYHKLTTVVIDPGHGRRDNGAQGKYYKEKNIAYSIAAKLKNILKANGIKVVMTRDKYSSIPLKLRPAMSLKYGGDMFVSIHCNASGKSPSSARGVETFIYAPVGTKSTNGGRATSQKMLGNIHDKNNARLGYEIQKNIINSKKYNIIDRGLKRSQFAVLKYSPIPAVLVETGFMSNPDEELLLGTDRYQNEIAMSIAKGIISYRNAILAREK